MAIGLEMGIADFPSREDLVNRISSSGVLVLLISESPMVHAKNAESGVPSHYC